MEESDLRNPNPPAEAAPSTDSNPGDADSPAPAAGGPRGRRRRRGRRGRGRGGEARDASQAQAHDPERPAAEGGAEPHAHAARGERHGEHRPEHPGEVRRERHGEGRQERHGERRHERHAGGRRERHGEHRGEGRHEPGEHRHERRHEHHGERPRGMALDPEMPNPAHEPEIPLDRLDADGVKVIARLRHMGHQAYFVGGCVRDLLLGRTPKDFDICTDAHPGEVRAIFRNCRLIGRRFRLAHVYFRGGKILEVATFRANPIDVAEDVPGDADLLITRDNVFGTAEEDARRRDFTVNGLFYDPFLGEVIDYVGGRADLEAHRIATIGDPEIRMREDPVRALRAVRFAARHGFAIEPEVFEAMRRHAGELARCAPPRVLDELFKILRCTGAARAMELLRSAGALAVVLPSLARTVEAGGPEGRARFHAFLTALDQLVKGEDEVSDAVLLGTLLIHLHKGEEGEAEAERLLAELVQTARLPRRVAERARMALSAQRLFHGPPRRRRRRRGGDLAAQAYFQDALQLLEITWRATGDGAGALERWRAEGDRTAPGREEVDPSELARDEEADTVPAGAVEVPVQVAGSAHRPASGEIRVVDVGGGGGSPEGTGPRRRRRRGGRRRRRRGGGGMGADSAQPSDGGA